MRAPVDQRSPWLALAGFIFSVVLALMVEAVSARMFGPGGSFANFVLIALFIWSIRRPWFLSPPVILLAGLAHDLVSGGPLGVWALAYLAAFTIARDRDADGSGADFASLAARFTVLMAVATLAAWAAGSVATGFPAPLGGLIGEAVLTIIIFALFGWAFARRRERKTFF
jgi:rod shape-determining protein MreD